MKRNEMGPGWVFVPLWWVALALVIIGYCAEPADAHTIDELTAWELDWQQRAAHTLDDALMSEWRDMRDRHPCFPEVCAVADRTVRAQRFGTTTAPSGVEQWRSLVAFYWPAEHVERMLRIMSCESHGNTLAVNARSGAAGLFQIMPGWQATWPGDYFDPWVNAAVAYQIWLSQGYRAWACRG